MLLGQQCCETLLLNVAIIWPEHVNAAGSTMLGCCVEISQTLRSIDTC